MTRVLVVERDGRGHRHYYVRLLLEAASAVGMHPVLVLTKTSSSAAEAAVHLQGWTGEVAIIPDACRLTGLEDAAAQLNADVVVVPDGDDLVADLVLQGWSHSSNIRVLVMRASPQSRRVIDLARWASKAGLARLAAKRARINVFYLRPSHAVARKLSDVIDPTEFSPRADLGQFREEWGLDTDRHWFGVLGSITPRKNAALVARALRLVPPGRNLGLLIAGRLDPTVRADLDQITEGWPSSHRIVVRDAMLTDQELDSAVSTCAVLVLAHSNEGPSGLLGKAVAAGTYVLAAGARSLRRDVSNIPSARWVPLDAESMAAAMTEISKAASGRPRSPGSTSAPVRAVATFTDPLIATEQTR
jgi:glycosyltransferase involved in cell wall biosynthesis